MDEKIYWEDLMEELVQKFGITILVKTAEGVTVYLPKDSVEGDPNADI